MVSLCSYGSEAGLKQGSQKDASTWECLPRPCPWPRLTRCCRTALRGRWPISRGHIPEAPFVTAPHTPASCPGTWTFVGTEAAEALRPAQGYTCAPQKREPLSHKMNFDQREVGAGRHILPSFSPGPRVRSHMFRRLRRDEPYEIKPSATLSPQRRLAGS